MSTVTTYMGLTAWTESDDPYSHVQFATNWNLVDTHDHTSGKGRQIPTGGIVDHAVTRAKLGEPCVDTTNYYDNSITAEKLSDSLLAAIVPLGLVYHFWSPSSAMPVIWGDGRASGKLFELCDGRVVAQADHDFPVGASITLPNLIARFVYGGPLSEVAQTGGNSAAAMAHSHTVNPHSHTVAGHTHTVGAHAHSVAGDLNVAAHAHTFASGHQVHSRRNVPQTGDGSVSNNPLQFRDVATNVRTFSLQSLYIAGFAASSPPYAFDDEPAPMDTAGGHGSHSHGGATGSSSPSTTASSPGTDAQAPSTNSALGTVALLPPYYTLVPVVRVRNP
jgi:hypothetical protein